MQRWVMVSLILLLLIGSVQAQSPDILAEADSIQVRVEAIRGLDADPDRSLISQGDLQALILATWQADYDQEVADDRALFNYAFNWTTQPAALTPPASVPYNMDWYSYQQQILYVRQEDFAMSPLRQVLYSLSYTQALVDAAFDSGDLLDENIPLDQQLAHAALVNGDAYYTMQRYLEQWLASEDVVDQLVRSAAFSPGQDMMNQVQPFTGMAEAFTYRRGADFVRTIFLRGDWEAVNQLYENPPISTEQILHPDLYDTGDTPRPIAALEWEADNAELVMDDRLGEFGIREHLDTLLDALTARVVAAGWNGDRFQLYRTSAPDQFVLIWQIEWDSELDAAEFNENYDLFLNQRLNAAATIIEQDISEGLMCWQSGQSTCLLRESQSSLVVYAPDLETAQLIIEQYRTREP